MTAATQWRRARIVERHLLDGRGRSALEAAGAVVALHASDPATVHLSVLARCGALTLADVSRELYDERRLVRMMAMRRTLFVVPADSVAVVHHAAAVDVAATMRRTLIRQLATLPTDPPLTEDPAGWLDTLVEEVAAAVQGLGSPGGAQVGAAVPRLRTAFLPTTTKAYDVRRTVTTQVLTLAAAEGRIVRGRPTGGWTSRQHTWEPAATWWPDGLEQLDPEEARQALVRAYLASFGPVTEADVAWWTGWPLGRTRAALAAVGPERLDGGLMSLGGGPGEGSDPGAVASLLPALDPTAMGWKQREWYLPDDPRPLYDANGNVGPTVWWRGEVVGGWAVRADGSVATRLLADRGTEAASAIREQADVLEHRLGGAAVVPSFRTPLERELSR